MNLGLLLILIGIICAAFVSVLLGVIIVIVGLVVMFAPIRA